MHWTTKPEYFKWEKFHIQAMIIDVVYFNQQTGALHAVSWQNHLFWCFHIFFWQKGKHLRNRAKGGKCCVFRPANGMWSTRSLVENNIIFFCPFYFFQYKFGYSERQFNANTNILNRSLKQHWHKSRNNEPLKGQYHLPFIKMQIFVFTDKFSNTFLVSSHGGLVR